jgi:glycosyltransferase involved in cell wall biosynthesis
VHDAFAWRHPDSIGKIKSLYWRIFIPLSIARAAQVICVSASTAGDLHDLLKVPRERMRVVHLAGGQLAGIDPAPELGESLGLVSGEYFLAVGVFKKIKNPYMILEAYQHYRTLVREPKKMVLVGGVFGADAEEILAKAAGIAGVVSAGRASDPELRWLYENSKGLVFVSLYEGFGIPILEAQRLGCPVITATNSSMPEVAGDGAILVSAGDVHGLAHAMERLHDLTFATELAEKGRANEFQFTWAKAAKETLTVLAGRNS